MTQACRPSQGLQIALFVGCGWPPSSSMHSNWQCHRHLYLLPNHAIGESNYFLCVSPVNQIKAKTTARQTKQTRAAIQHDGKRAGPAMRVLPFSISQLISICNQILFQKQLKKNLSENMVWKFEELRCQRRMFWSSSKF